MTRKHAMGGLACALILLLTGPFSGFAATPQRSVLPPSWDSPHVSGQLLVKLPASSAVHPYALGAVGGRVVRTIPQLGLALIEVPAAQLLAGSADALVETGAVEWAEPNYTFQLDFTPNDPEYSRFQSRYLTALEMPAAWELSAGRPEVIIAILDTGIDATHPDLAGAIWTNPGEVGGNGLDDDKNGFVDDLHGWDFPDNDNLPSDDHGHGTHVAGIAAARANNGIGIAGMAPLATLMPVDVFKGGIGAYDDLIRAIIYATDNGAHVINMSLGASSYSLGEQMAVDYATAHGVLVVAAAGNDGREAYHYPAAHASVVAVGATQFLGNPPVESIAGISTRGDFVDLVAPGVSIYSTFPGGGYGFLTGTSMATPHVAGLAALLLARNPTLGPAELRAALEGTAEDMGPAGWDKAYGHGRINARRALEAVAPDPSPVPDRKGPPLGDLPAGCVEVVAGGGFEEDGAWSLSGTATIDASQPLTGVRSLHFPASASTATVTQTVTFPAFPYAGLLRFGFRIENMDFGKGTLPSFPYDDWLVAELRSPDGAQIVSLLRTGNSADTASSGLPWDRYYFRMQTGDLARWRGLGQAVLVFRAANDGDAAPTEFWVDDVSFCVSAGRPRYFSVMFK